MSALPTVADACIEETWGFYTSAVYNRGFSWTLIPKATTTRGSFQLVNAAYLEIPFSGVPIYSKSLC